MDDAQGTGAAGGNSRRAASAAPHLRTALGRQVRMKYTPELTFREDPAIEQGARIEAIIRGISHDADPRRPAVDDRRARRRGRAPRSAASAIDAAPTVALACHVNPDGDALGSMLGPVPRVARRRPRRRRVVPAAVPRRTALPRPPRARPAHQARRLPGRARGDGHLRLRFARPTRRAPVVGRGGARAHRPRPPRVEHAVTARSTSSIPTPPRAASSSVACVERARPRAQPRRRACPCTPRWSATPGASSTTPPRQRCSTSRAS